MITHQWDAYYVGLTLLAVECMVVFWMMRKDKDK